MTKRTFTQEVLMHKIDRGVGFKALLPKDWVVTTDYIVLCCNRQTIVTFLENFGGFKGHTVELFR